MVNVWLRTIVACVGLAQLVGVTSQLLAQQGTVVTLHPTGVVRITADAVGEAEPVVIELNAHGPEWKHAPQETATAEVSDLPGGVGKQFVGTLPIPNTDGGSIKYVQKVKALPMGLALEYDVAMTKDMRLNGLQVSILLPVSRYAGQSVEITRPEGEPQTVVLPQQEKGENFVLWTGEGSKVEVAKGTPGAMSIELRAAADIVVQDLRRWERSVYEVRFPAILEDAGRDVTTDDRLHFDLTIALPQAPSLQGP
jgi:hypothetical protein